MVFYYKVAAFVMIGHFLYDVVTDIIDRHNNK